MIQVIKDNRRQNILKQISFILFQTMYLHVSRYGKVAQFHKLIEQFYKISDEIQVIDHKSKHDFFGLHWIKDK